MTRDRSIPAEARPAALGTGLLALDIIRDVHRGASGGDWAGGTCGNVLIALAYLGWDARPVARLGCDAAARRIREDLVECGVATTYVTLSEDGSTPIIVERIDVDAAGNAKHSFSWRCPGCGARYPGYKPVLVTTANGVAEVMGSPRVFFFDRVSPGALILARATAARGGLVVFEPSGVGNPALFRDAWMIAHIVKYSHERLREIPDLDLAERVPLQIETLGPDGLRYRSCLRHARMDRWETLGPFPVTKLRDSAGAGDWCTAGIVHRLGDSGADGFASVSSDHLNEAFRFGQALAAWTCGFAGPRGGMYLVNRQSFDLQIRLILEHRHAEGSPPPDALASETHLASLCPACGRERGGKNLPDSETPEEPCEAREPLSNASFGEN